MIASEITTSDGELRVTLDAQAYFEQAPYEYIEQLIRDGLTGGADSVAGKLFSFYKASAANDVWRYCDSPPNRYDQNPVGWTVNVERETLCDWLESKSYHFLANEVAALVPRKRLGI